MKRFSKFISESAEINEKLKASDDMDVWIRDFEDSDAPQFKGKSKKKRREMAIAAKYAAEREAGMREEAEDLEELKKSTLASYVNKASDDRAQNAFEIGKSRKINFKGLKRRQGIQRATKRLAKEEVELDEAIGDTLKKAGTKIFGPSKQEKEAAKRKADMKKMHAGSHDQNVKSAIDGAGDPKHTGHQGMNSYHSQMAKDHKGTPAAKHHESAANSHAEAQHHLEKYKKSGDANSLKKAVQHSGNAVKHAQAAVKAGGSKADSHHVHASTQNAMYYHKKMNESVELDEVLDTPQAMQSYRNKAKASKERAAKSAVATVLRSKDKETRAHPAKDLKTIAKRTAGEKMVDRNVARKFRNSIRKEEVDLNEKAPKMKGDWLKKEREKNRAHDAAMGRTPTGRKKPVRQMTSTQRSLAKMRGESSDNVYSEKE